MNIIIKEKENPLGKDTAVLSLYPNFKRTHQFKKLKYRGSFLFAVVLSVI